MVSRPDVPVVMPRRAFEAGKRTLGPSAFNSRAKPGAFRVSKSYSRNLRAKGDVEGQSGTQPSVYAFY